MSNDGLGSNPQAGGFSLSAISVAVDGVVVGVIIDPNAIYVDKDHSSASDSNPGTESLPFLTIQPAIDLVDGTKATIYIKHSTVPYEELVRKSGAAVGGPTVLTGGVSASQRLVIEGFPGDDMPVIDQNYEDAVGASAGTAAIFLWGASYVDVIGLDIQHINSSGVRTLASGATLVTDCTVDHCHIHDIQGGDNIGGVRLDDANGCVVKNNIIHDIYYTGALSNLINAVPLGLHSGVHGYRPKNCIIENNLFYTLERAVFQKTPSASLEASHVVRNNIAYDCYKLVEYSLAGGGEPPIRDAEVYGNLAYDLVGTPIAFTQIGSSAQSSTALVYNNTVDSSEAMVSIRENDGVEFFNNISTNIADYAVVANASVTHDSEYSYIDHNLYFGVTKFGYTNRNSSPLYQYDTLALWRGAFTDGATNILANPDINGDEFDPVYTDAAGGDFTTSAAAVATMGRGGSYSSGVGCYELGGFVGPDWSIA